MAGRINEVIEAGVDAFNGEDHERLLDLLTDDVEWKRVDGLPARGRRALVRPAAT